MCERYSGYVSNNGRTVYPGDLRAHAACEEMHGLSAKLKTYKPPWPFEWTGTDSDAGAGLTVRALERADSEGIEAMLVKRFGTRGGYGKWARSHVPKWVRLVDDFIEREILRAPWFRPRGEPDPTWMIFDTRAVAWDAARAVARDAAWDAARNAARDAARAVARAVAWDAARAVAWDAAEDAARAAARAVAWDAAWDAAEDAARAAAEAAARAAARDAAQDAARDAAWGAAMLVCDDLPLEKRHIDHARVRWDVWRRGYGLLCDVDGVLYVYRKP